MMTIFERRRTLRSTSWLVAASLAFPLFLTGCGGKGADTSNVPPPVDDTRRGAPTTAPMATTPVEPAKKPGMSTGKKVVVALAGAALLYYLYKHHQKQEGQEVQYYKSEKNGRIYYRDPKTHQAHWVTPAPSYELDDQEAQEMSKYKGYNNATGGEDYRSPSSDSGSAPD